MKLSKKKYYKIREMDGSSWSKEMTVGNLGIKIRLQEEFYLPTDNSVK